jgi:hypothetical protein
MAFNVPPVKQNDVIVFTTDFSGLDFGVPWECYNSKTTQNAVCLATVSIPFIVINGK